MPTNAPVSAFTRVRDIQKRARERKSDLGAHSIIIANLQPSPQPEPEVPPSQRAFTEAQNESNKLIEENKQLKRQIEDQAELKSRIVYLERADRQYREITRHLRRFTAANGRIARRPPQFDVSRTPDSSSASRLQTAADDMWLHMMQKELDLAKEARKGNWKETITLLEVQIELERQERQTFAATVESTMADLKRKNEELQRKIHEQEQSEKHCHQVLNLLDSFIESHPGEGVSSSTC